MTTDLNIARLLERGVSRRDFVRATGGSMASLIVLGTLPANRGDSRIRLRDYPFTLGVASGDPTPTGLVLWTRLAPDPLRGGGMPEANVPVKWELASDEAFTKIVKKGEQLATPHLAHSVHVEVEGLEPDRIYWYRFMASGEQSPVGRTRTAPAVNSKVASFSLAFASCQSYQDGYYTALRHMSNEDVRLVVFLGDYIYEGGINERGVRRHTSPEIKTLDDYRNRYALYKSDPDLQAAHANFPWTVTWDDHEVDNNYAGAVAEDLAPQEEFLKRRAAAYQAYYEHMPLRRAQMPSGPLGADLRLYRGFRFGDLLSLSMLDTRQYRSDQPCGDSVTPHCEQSLSPSQTIMGDVQEKWLLDSLAASTTRWNLIGNQLPMADIDRIPGSEVGFQMDQWSGYKVMRDRVVKALLDRKVSNPIVITGDVHQSWVTDIALDAFDTKSPIVGTEFVGTSIASGGDGVAMHRNGQAIVDENPHVKYYSALRGYVRCTITPDKWVSDYRLVDFISKPNAPVKTDRTFVVEAGKAGVQV